MSRRAGLRPTAAVEAERQAIERAAGTSKPESPKKKPPQPKLTEAPAAPRGPYSFRLDPAVVGSVRNAVVYLETLANASAAGLIDKPAPKTVPGMSEFVESALQREVARLAKRYNDGNLFPARATDPKRGRRPES